MYRNYLSLCFLASISNICAQGPGVSLDPGHISRRATNRSVEDCSNPNENPTAECWATLGVDTYIQQWWTANSASCSSGVYEGSGFASCYQQKVGKGALLNDNCDKIGVSNCRPPTNISSYDIKEYYVLTSIFGIWQWFNSVYYASDFANGIASGKIGDIVTTINPIQSDDGVGIALSVLTAGLAFLDVPATAALGVIKATAVQELSVGSFKTALKEAPGLAKALMAPATLAGQFTEKNNIASTLATIVSAFQANIANGLQAAQQNFSNFLPVATNGNYIAGRSSLNASTAVLTQVLTTYITSQALLSKGFRISAGVGAPYLTSSAHTVNDKFYGCEAVGVSKLDWVIKHCGKSYLDLVIAKGWATEQGLVYGACSCGVATVVANGSPLPPPSLNTTSLEPLCISNLPVYIRGKYRCVVRQGCSTPSSPLVQPRDELNGKTQREWAAAGSEADRWLKAQGA